MKETVLLSFEKSVPGRQTPVIPAPAAPAVALPPGCAASSLQGFPNFPKSTWIATTPSLRIAPLV